MNYYKRFLPVVFCIFGLMAFLNPAQSQNCQITVSSNEGCVGQHTISFILQFDGNRNISSITWDFGDNISSSDVSPIHSYNDRGNYIPSAVVTFDDGTTCNVTYNGTMHIYGIPKADLTVDPGPHCYNDAQGGILFSDLSTMSEDNSPIVSWRWGFGDGNTSNDQNPTHIYLVGSSYGVTLAIVDDNGCAADITVPGAVQIYPQIPLNFRVNGSPSCPFTDYTIVNLSSLPIDSVANFTWLHGDGTSNSTSWSGFDHRYHDDSTFENLTLMITHVNGCEEMIKCDQTTQSFCPKNINYRFLIQQMQGYEPVCFSQRAITFDQPPRHDAFYVEWEFGDPDHDENINDELTWNPTHEYTAPGLYSIRLLIMEEGCTRDTVLCDFVKITGPMAMIHDDMAENPCRVPTHYPYFAGVTEIKLDTENLKRVGDVQQGDYISLRFYRGNTPDAGTLSDIYTLWFNRGGWTNPTPNPGLEVNLTTYGPNTPIEAILFQIQQTLQAETEYRVLIKGNSIFIDHVAPRRQLIYPFIPFASRDRFIGNIHHARNVKNPFNMDYPDVLPPDPLDIGAYPDLSVTGFPIIYECGGRIDTMPSPYATMDTTWITHRLRSYDVQGAFGKNQTIDIAVDSPSFITINDYFFIYTPSQTYYVWFDSNGTGTDPNPGGIGIRVDIAGINSPEALAALLANVLNASAGFSAVVSNRLNYVIKVEYSEAGKVSDPPQDGIMSASFIYNVINIGKDTTEMKDTVIIFDGDIIFCDPADLRPRRNLIWDTVTDPFGIRIDTLIYSKLHDTIFIGDSIHVLPDTIFFTFMDQNDTLFLGVDSIPVLIENNYVWYPGEPFPDMDTIFIPSLTGQDCNDIKLNSGPNETYINKSGVPTYLPFMMKMHDTDLFIPNCAAPNTVTFLNLSMKYRFRHALNDYPFDPAMDEQLSPNWPYASDSMLYEWDFGDGNSSNDALPVHTYLQDGCWTVTLKVTDTLSIDGRGEYCTDETTVDIAMEPPDASGVAFNNLGPMCVGSIMTHPWEVDLAEVKPGCSQEKWWVAPDSAGMINNIETCQSCPKPEVVNVTYDWLDDETIGGLPGVYASPITGEAVIMYGFGFFSYLTPGCKTAGFIVQTGNCYDTAWVRDIYVSQVMPQFEYRVDTIDGATNPLWGMISPGNVPYPPLLCPSPGDNNLYMDLDLLQHIPTDTIRDTIIHVSVWDAANMADVIVTFESVRNYGYSPFNSNYNLQSFTPKELIAYMISTNNDTLGVIEFNKDGSLNNVDPSNLEFCVDSVFIDTFLFPFATRVNAVLEQFQWAGFAPPVTVNSGQVLYAQTVSGNLARFKEHDTHDGAIRLGFRFADLVGAPHIIKVPPPINMWDVRNIPQDTVYDICGRIQNLSNFQPTLFNGTPVPADTVFKCVEPELFYYVRPDTLPDNSIVNVVDSAYTEIDTIFYRADTLADIDKRVRAKFTTPGIFQIVSSMQNREPYNCALSIGQVVHIGHFNDMEASDTIICAGETVSFRDSVYYFNIPQQPFFIRLKYNFPNWYDPTKPETISYDFNGDGNIDFVREYKTDVAEYTYDKPGTYRVTMYTVDSIGCVMERHQNIHVVGLEADFYLPKDTFYCAVGGVQEVQARDTSRILNDIIGWNIDYFASADTCILDSVPIKSATIASRHWHFEEGFDTIKGNVKDPSYFYNFHGVYSVSLVTTLNIPGDQCVDTTIDTVVILGPKPEFTVTLNPGCAPHIVEIKNTSKDVDSYEWLLGNNTISSDSGETVYLTYWHAPNGIDTFYLRLRVSQTLTLPNGDTIVCLMTIPHFEDDTSFFEVIVWDTNRVNFTASKYQACVDETIEFEVMEPADPEYTQWVWDFGDGSSPVITSSPVPQFHSYSDTGTYVVTLKPLGAPCPDTAARTITIQKVIAEFDYEKDDNTAGRFTFENMSSGLNLEYEWHFGEGKSPSNLEHPEYTFSNVYPDGIEVCLTVTDNYGCQDTYCEIITFDKDILIPNIFTPNDDLHNNIFTVTAEEEVAFEMVIFNRWGEKVFESEHKNQIWDGTNKNDGTECAPGTYFYIINYKLLGDTKDTYVSGTVTLVR